MEPALLEALRHDIQSADFTEPAIRALISEEAQQLLKQGSPLAARQQVLAHPQSPLTSLVRLFVIGDTLTLRELTTAFPTLAATGLAPGMVVEEATPGHFRAALSVTPVEVSVSGVAHSLWIMSDLDDHLRQRPAAVDHVMGIGGATQSLLRLIPTLDAGMRVLDLGTGSGIIALACALQGAHVTATDLSERALMFSRANAVLNQINNIGFRQGDLFAPVAEQTFDFVLSNPPFVISAPAHSNVHEYRSSAVSGDALMQRVVQHVPKYLSPGGEAIFLGNWEAHWGSGDFERVQEWITSGPAANNVAGAWVVAREVVSPLRYAHTWARDGGLLPGTAEYDEHVALALEDFRTRRVTRLMLGWFRIRVAATQAPIIHTEEATGELATSDESQFSDVLQQVMSVGLAATAATDAELRAARLVRASGVREVREYVPGNADPSIIWLTVAGPIGRSISVDTATAAVVGACDGELTVSQLALGLANIFGGDDAEYTTQLVPIIRELAWCGVFQTIEFPAAD